MITRYSANLRYTGRHNEGYVMQGAYGQSYVCRYDGVKEFIEGKCYLVVSPNPFTEGEINYISEVV